MVVTYTRVDDGNLDAPAREALGPQLVHLRHDVRRELVLGLVGRRAPLDVAKVLPGVGADPLDARAGHVVQLQRPHVAHLGQGGELGRLLVGLFHVVELHRDALEELKVELHARRALLLHRAVEGVGVLARQREASQGGGGLSGGRGRPIGSGGGGTYMTGLELEDEGARDDIVRRLGRKRSRGGGGGGGERREE